MDKESFIYSQFTSKLNGDDGAVLGKMVLSKDMFVEGSHFKRAWLSLEQIATKSMLVNLSDAVAMNATPKYALLGLGLPKDISNQEALKLTNAFKSSAAKFGVEIIGGDTVKSSLIIISLTIISYLNNGKAVSRNGAKIGDFICYTGELGDSLKGLKALQNGGKVASNSRFVKPNLRTKFMQKSAKFMRSAMDISDGLASDLPKILGKNSVKFDKQLSNLEFKSGEEYELLFCVSSSNLARVKNEAKKCRVKLNILGKIIKGRYKSYGKFSHF
ncbi:thiamine monophosphate kinase [Campylobacter iguaniorum]|uniref:Thiamine-monophosphate kinase n=1 Tax=Campylobacter iguaniorum TaxID=1244531 RepID=A0A076F9K9_9BACT|nr:thiamine-phosphate kinase [Campylobacter iguaniorum]AII14363.1 thiamine monophosphate kinase [Campylobacter iguaniorum]